MQQYFIDNVNRGFCVLWSNMPIIKVTLTLHMFAVFVALIDTYNLNYPL